MTELTELVSGPDNLATLITTAQEAAEAEVLEPGGIYAFRVGDHVQVVDLDLDKYHPRPRRKTGQFIVHDAASFIAYHKKHSWPETEIYADVARGTLVAVINAHNLEDAGWGDHRVLLSLRTTPAWQAWTHLDRKLCTQIEFAEHVEDRIPDFVTPSGADMLELAQSFSANRSVRFESSKRIKSGETQLVYKEETDAAAGKRGDMAIPDTFELGLIPYEGSDAYKVTARLRYRIGDGTLRIGYILDRPEDVQRSAFLDIVNQIEEHADQTVLRGVPA